MRVLLRVWLPLLTVIALVALVYLVANWSSLATTHRLSFAAAIVIILHMLEEEHFPGGFAYMFNRVVRTSDVPDRYPMSPLIAMIVDVFVFLFLFVPALFFPRLIWLGMAPMFLTLTEVLLHTVIGIFVQWRRKGMSIYNPGLVTAWMMAVIGVSYIVVITTGGMMSGSDWLRAVGYFVTTLVLFLVLPEAGLKSKTTPWAFTPDELLGYYKRYTTVEKVFGTRETNIGLVPHFNAAEQGG